MTDLALIACGTTVHALRGDQEAVDGLLDTLDRDQMQIVAVSALIALGEAVRTVPGGEDMAAHIALALQHQNLTTALEGDQP